MKYADLQWSLQGLSGPSCGIDLNSLKLFPRFNPRAPSEQAKILDFINTLDRQQSKTLILPMKVDKKR